MTPRDFEVAVAASLRADGFATELGRGASDYGVDIFATRNGVQFAVQAKMFGGTSRPVNRQMVMELHGAASYFDCAGAILATNGRVLADAREVARKLGIRIIDMSPPAPARSRPSVRDTERPERSREIGSLDFAAIWERYVLPLAGKTLTRRDGSSNTVVAVDWSGVERISSNGEHGRIKIEIFEWAIDRILRQGAVTRAEINDEYQGRASSGVVLVLGQVPIFETVYRPLTLRFRGGHLDPRADRTR